MSKTSTSAPASTSASASLISDQSSVFQLGAFELAKQIQSRALSSYDVVSSHIQAIQKINPQLNALVQDRFDQALAEAKSCDERIQQGEKNLPPLFGVPFTVKEMISVQGMRHTLGNVHRKEDIALSDASVVARLKKAGAIVLGTTNVPELGFWFECSNKIYGRTNNPYDLSRTSGGSSGGEGALIGARASVFGVGSDVGGSIRMPAAFCGLYGHKPSSHFLPLTGHFPVYENCASEFVGIKHPLTVLGPMTRKAHDLYPLMKIMMGPDGKDPEALAECQLKERVQDWSKITVWVMPSPSISGASRTEKEIKLAVERAADHFKTQGATIKTMRPTIFKKAVPLWFASMTRSEERSFVDVLTHGQKTSLASELARLLFRKSNYTLPAVLAALLEVGSKKQKDKLESVREGNLKELAELKNSLCKLLGETSILLMPVHPRVAPKHNAPLLRPFDFAYTGIFNSLEFPATSALMGKNRHGLPLSVQIIASAGQDHLTLSAAESLFEFISTVRSII